MSGSSDGLSGTWHVFGRDGNWVASSDGRSNTTVAQVFGFSPEEVKARALAVSAAPNLLKALTGDDLDAPECISPLSWLRSMVDACDSTEAANGLGGDDPDAWMMMVQEVWRFLDQAEAAVKKARGEL